MQKKNLTNVKLNALPCLTVLHFHQSQLQCPEYSSQSLAPPKIKLIYNTLPWGKYILMQTAAKVTFRLIKIIPSWFSRETQGTKETIKSKFAPWLTPISKTQRASDTARENACASWQQLGMLNLWAKHEYNSMKSKPASFPAFINALGITAWLRAGPCEK